MQKNRVKKVVDFEIVDIDKLSSNDLKAIGEYVSTLEKYGKTKAKKEVD